MDKAREYDEREELRDRLESWTEVPLNLLGIALLVILTVEFLMDLSPEWQYRLNAANWFIYAVFTLTFFVQLLLSPSRGTYLRRNWVAAISVLLPAFRVFRALRALRALRTLRFVRVLTATNRGTRSLSRMLRGHQFGRVVGLTVAVVAVGAAALVYFEEVGPRAKLSEYGDAVWWATTLVTTIGSDFQPETIEGRIVATLLVVWGLGVLGYITGSVASYFVGQGTVDERGVELERMRQEVAELRSLLTRALERQEGA